MRLLLAALLLTLPLLAHAHGDAHVFIQALDAQIRQDPGNAALYLKRGRQYLEAQHYQDARADLEHALALDPQLHGARYHLADTLHKAGLPAEAETAARRFVQAVAPDQAGALARGYWLLGDILATRGRHLEAGEIYRQALSHTAEPSPSQIQAYAEAYLEAEPPQPDAALAVIDQGLARLGPLDTLLEMAVDIELKRGRTDPALQRLDTLIAQGRRLPYLHLRKARALAEAGRVEPASAALAEARKALTQAHRPGRGQQALVGEMDALAAKLATSGGGR